MTTTTNLGITHVEQSQAQKEVTVNTALDAIDALMNVGAIDRALNTPPVSPSNGDVYIIGSSPTGDWAANADDIAYYQQEWKFLAPNEGMTLWVNDEDRNYSWDGSAWVTSTTESLDDLSDVAISGLANYDVLQYNGTNFVNSPTIGNLTGLGIGTSYDSNNKLSVAADSVLFNRATADMQVKVNKNTATDKASHLFQTGFSGRAEFGLIGEDDFSLKVSPDGSSYTQCFVVDKTTGNIDFKQDVSVVGVINGAELTNYSETKATNATASGSVSVDFANGNVHELTLTGNITTLTLSNPPASGESGNLTLILKQDATGSRTVTWPAAVKWVNGGTAPTLSTAASSVDMVSMFTVDGGTTYYATAMLDFA